MDQLAVLVVTLFYENGDLYETKGIVMDAEKCVEVYLDVHHAAEEEYPGLSPVTTCSPLFVWHRGEAIPATRDIIIAGSDL